MSKQKKTFLLVNSDDRTVTSSSSTDFTVKLQTPLRNVIKVEPMNVVVDYQESNVGAPDDSIEVQNVERSVAHFKIKSVPEDLADFLSELSDYIHQVTNLLPVFNTENSNIEMTLPANAIKGPQYFHIAGSESIYYDILGLDKTDLVPTYNQAQDAFVYQFPVMPDLSKLADITTTSSGSFQLNYANVLISTHSMPQVYHQSSVLLAENLNILFGDRYEFNLVSGRLVVTASASGQGVIAPFLPQLFKISVQSQALRTILGLSGPDLLPTVISGEDVLKWQFPRLVKLPARPPYLLLQSQELGNNVRNAAGDVNLFHVLAPQDSISRFYVDKKSESDTYYNEPRTIAEIDLAVLKPNKSVLQNNGGAVQLLLQIIQTV
jgi:hypothetical protein